MKSPKPWLAALLGLFDAPVGLLYAGYVRVFWLCWAALLACYAIFAVFVATGKIRQFGLIAILCMLLIVRLSFPVMSYRYALQAKGKPRRWFQRWYVIIAIIVFGTLVNQSCVLVVRSSILESFYVSGRAMAPTISHAERIMVDKVFGSAETLSRGDLVVFKSAPKGPLFVMRVVGLPGDTVKLEDETLRLNGEIVNEEYASYLSSPYEVPAVLETRVPGRHFFVLGDNRNFSNDSRILGPIPFESYYGRPTNIFWSRDYRVTEDRSGLPTYEVGPVQWNRLGRNLMQ